MGSAGAGVVFEKETIRLQAAVTDEQVTATFAFSYTGQRPILIKEVDANCGCISAQTDKKRYVKGERGKLTVVFEVGGKEGLQSNKVWMAWLEELAPGEKKFSSEIRGPSGEDPNDFIAPIRKDLTVEIDIPVVVEIEPKMTTWQQGAAPEPRKVTVTMHHLTPIHLTKVTSTRQDVKVETEVVEKGKKYVLTLTPATTEKKQLGMLTLETDCSLQRYQKRLAFFSFAADLRGQGPGKASGTPQIIGPEGQKQGG